jgi:hypothetical protein
VVIEEEEEHPSDSRFKVELMKTLMKKVENELHVEVQEEIDREGDEVWVALLSNPD